MDNIRTLSSAIVNNGYRLTPARQAIIEAFVKCEGHITADDLVSKVHEQAPHVGRMTVYRTLDLLSGLGVIRPIYQGTGAAHYILMAASGHHHLICVRCHQVIEFEDCMGQELTEKLGQRFNFQVRSHLLEVQGVCQTCGE